MNQKTVKKLRRLAKQKGYPVRFVRDKFKKTDKATKKILLGSAKSK